MGLHELLGHGSGKLFMQVREPSLTVLPSVVNTSLGIRAWLRPSPRFVCVQDENGKFNFDHAEVRNPETGELVRKFDMNIHEHNSKQGI